MFQLWFESTFEHMESLKKTARMAGVWYLVLAIAGAYGIMYVPSQIVVPNDPTATANNLLAHEFLFRVGIASNVVGQVAFLFLALTLYQLFRQVNERQAKLLVALVVAAVPVAFLIIFNEVAALLILKEEFMNVLAPPQRHLWAMLFLTWYSYGITLIGIFWGLWLIPFGRLVYQSGFIPKIIGILLIIGGIAYIIDTFIFLLFPSYRAVSSQLVGVLSSLGELSVVLWLLIKGVKTESK
jgi:hypothetical protein